MNIVLLGAPGSGKGTQATRMTDEFGIPQISTGDILRAALKKGTEMGLKAKEYMDKGALVPDDVIIGIMQDRLKEKDAEKGFILDGFPRTIKQAEALDAMLTKMGKALDHVVSVYVSEDELLKRMTGRRTCRSCGAMYHETFGPPKKQGVCDKCGGELYTRDDDKEETIKARFKVYKDSTFPLIDYYKAKKLLRDIEGLGSIDEIYSRIKGALRMGA
jgi:adenylate kinase